MTTGSFPQARQDARAAPAEAGGRAGRLLELGRNAFHLLGASVLDDRRRIAELADAAEQVVDPDAIRRARAELTHPRARLAAEVGWFPGLAPARTAELLRRIRHDPLGAWQADDLHGLARAHALVAGVESLEAHDGVETTASLVLALARHAGTLDVQAVVRDIDADRLLAGYPPVRDVDDVRTLLAERRRAWAGVVRDALDRLPSGRLLDVLTRVVDGATQSGTRHAPVLVDEILERYEVETKGLLEEEARRIGSLVEALRAAAPHGEMAMEPALMLLEQRVRAWHRLVRPLLIGARARGSSYASGRELALRIRDVGVDVVNGHRRFAVVRRLGHLLGEAMAHDPEVQARLAEDAAALEQVARQHAQELASEAQRLQAITYEGEVGMLLLDPMSVSVDGIRWRDHHVALQDVTAVRWGGFRQTSFGLPILTEYTIGIASARGSFAVRLGDETHFQGLSRAVWAAVGSRLILDMARTLRDGHRLRIGDIDLADGDVTLANHAFLAPRSRRTLDWASVALSSKDGNLVITSSADRKVYSVASYMTDWNVHVAEQLVRLALQKGWSRLSQLLPA